VTDQQTGLTRLCAAVLIWAAWFVFLYGGLAVGCTIAPPPLEAGARNGLSLLLGLGTLLAFAGLAGIAVAPWRRALPGTARSGSRERFVAFLTAGVCIASAVSMPLIALPLLALPPCA
jgi:hypothetical protein